MRWVRVSLFSEFMIPHAAGDPVAARIVPDVDSFADSIRRFEYVPVVCEIAVNGVSVVDILKACPPCDAVAVLESGKDGRYSYIAVEPTKIEIEADAADPLQRLCEALDPRPVAPNSLVANFVGGAIGVLSYDLCRSIERLPSTTLDDLRVDDLMVLRVDNYFEVDHARHLVRCVSVRRDDGRSAADQYAAACVRIETMAAILALAEQTPDAPRAARRADRCPPAVESPAAEESVTQARFEQMVRTAREYILAGDVFQVNLSIRYDVPLEADPLELYEELRAINPSPYMAYLRIADLAVVSASPEQLIRVQAGEVVTRPIAGTRPRGATDADDRAFAEELIANPKERAEHLMLVDLERNDIGRVAEFGSVVVDELMAIERYSHVMHLVSSVRGRLRPGCDVVAAVRACFPGGTITGAPKIRAMEIIEELEPVRRGVYTGSIGWIGYDGSAEFNIAIRTIVVKHGVAYAQAGAGIVADSDPTAEYHESHRKARAALEAIARANRRSRERTADGDVTLATSGEVR